MQMINRLPDIATQINPTNPFEKCKLGRKKYADELTSIVKNSDGGVIALDGKWGTGKTTFVKMWQASLENENIKVLYFNVWENDNTVDPLIDLMAQLYVLLKDVGGVAFDNVIEEFRKIVPQVLKPIAKCISEHCIGTDITSIPKDIHDAWKSTTEIKKAFYELTEAKKAIEEFKKGLQKVLAAESDSSPLICIIDELDRCNPHYAVKVLERVKHLFSIPNIVFVLAIDKEQLGYAIQGYYGSGSINAEEYLRRFIDLDLVLPTPQIHIADYIEYLLSEFQFDKFFYDQARISKINEGNYERQSLSSMVRLIIKNSHCTLRQAEKIMSHMRLVLRGFRSDEYSYPDIIILLLWLRLTDRAFYDGIRLQKPSVQEFIDGLITRFDFWFIVEKDAESLNTLTNCLARIVFAYNLDNNKNPIIKLIDEDNNNLLIDIGNIPTEKFVYMIKNLYSKLSLYSKNISQYIDKIENINTLTK